MRRRTALLMQHRDELVVPDSCAGVRLRRADRVIRRHGWPRCREGETPIGATATGRAGGNRDQRCCGWKNAGRTIADVWCFSGVRSERWRVSGGWRRQRLSAGRRNHANQGGGTQYNEYGDNDGDTHGGLLRLRVTNARCHCSTVSRGWIGQVADKQPTDRRNRWQQ
jgi:hypothetical protein